MPATFVLVHGAWLGGWCWKKVTPLLRAAGHEVFAPTLTGLGERSHLFSPEVGLDTHVVDIVAVLDHEDLTDVILFSTRGFVPVRNPASDLHPMLKQLPMLRGIRRASKATKVPVF
jgi:hypothetical protein